MEFAYKIPEKDRAIVLANDHKGHEAEGIENLPELLEKLHKEWPGMGGPQDEREKAIFDALPDLVKSITDPSVNGEESPAVARMIVVLNDKDAEADPTHVMASFEKESFLPALAAGLGLAEGAGMGAVAGAAAKQALPFLGKGLAVAGLGNMMGGGGSEQVPVEPTDVYASFRSKTEDDAGTLHFAIRVDRELEALRAQVIAALNAWANGGADGGSPMSPEVKAVWWSQLDAAKNADSISQLVLILQGIPQQFHNAIDMMPSGGIDEDGNPTNGLPENTPSPGIESNPAGSQPETGDVQTNLIPGALSSVIKDLGIDFKESNNMPGVSVPDPFSSPASGTPDQTTSWINQKALELQGTGMDPTQAFSQAAMLFAQQQGGNQNQQPGPAGQTQTQQTPAVSPIADTTSELYTDVSHNLPSAHTAAEFSTIEKEMPMELDQAELLNKEDINDWQDAEGTPLKHGQTYKMTTDKYDVPDLVRVVASTPEGLVLHVENGKGGYEIKVGEKEKRSSNIRFEKFAHSLSDVQQKDLVLEEGIARNLDRLNLSHSHYESEYPNFHSNVKEFLDVSIPLSNVSLLEDDSLLFI